MAFTRIAQAGAETGSITEMPAEYTNGGGSSMTTSTTAPKTSSRSFSATTAAYSRGWTFSSQATVRGGMFFRHNGFSPTSSVGGNLFHTIVGGVTDVSVNLRGSTSVLEILVGGVQKTSIAIASTPLSAIDTYFHLGFTHYADATSGYVSFYIDGVQYLTWTGNTGSGITAAYFGGTGYSNSLGYSATSGWTSSSYMDDVYLDGSATNEADAIPPTRYFVWSVANTAGNYAQWTASAGTNVSCVDEVPPNSDTDYVAATVANKLDSYNTANPTLPAGTSPVANIAVAFAKRTDAAFASTIAMGFRESSTDAVGSDITLTTSYSVVMERTTTKPSGGAWDTTAINAAEVLIKSTGTF